MTDLKHRSYKLFGNIFLIIILFNVIIFSSTFINSKIALAQPSPQNQQNNNEVAKDAWNILNAYAPNQQADKSNSIYQIIGSVINIILGFVGVLFLGLIIHGGFKWMTAGGNEEKIHEAVRSMVQASVGLAIVVMAFILTNYIILKLIQVII